MTNNPPSQNQPSLRILFVDDDQNITMTFSWMLEIMGHDVRVAHDGPSAMAIAQTFVPQVVLLDISMPGMSGYEVCQKLRAMPELANSMLVAQTGWSHPELQERSILTGFHDHVVKPITIDRMEELLTSYKIKQAA